MSELSGLLKCAGFLVNEAAVKQLLKGYAEEVEVKWHKPIVRDGVVMVLVGVLSKGRLFRSL